MKKLIFIILALAVYWFVFNGPANLGSVNLGPGVKAPNLPKQEKISSPKKIQFKNYTITPLAKFHIKAKVLSKKKYSWGRETDLSSVDLALGWGNMSDENIISAIDISQSNRWYKWWTNNFPIPRNEIETHSANMHLIPANKSVADLITRTRKGEIIELSGHLVRVDAKDGWHWVSSLTRNDTGKHACELIWVKKYKIQETKK